MGLSTYTVSESRYKKKIWNEEKENKNDGFVYFYRSQAQACIHINTGEHINKRIFFSLCVSGRFTEISNLPTFF
jgi:hypothetical protein